MDSIIRADSGQTAQGALGNQRRLKVAILGTTDTRLQAPFDDPEWEIWGLGPHNHYGRRWDRWLEIHSRDTWEFVPLDEKGAEQYLAFLNDRAGSQNRTVYTLSHIPGLAEQQQIDRAFLEQKYGRMWFSSSVSWAFALALELGAKEIGLYGIDMEWGEEYVLQFQGLRHFMDLARLAGVDLLLPGGSALFRDPPPYPDQWEQHFGRYTQRKIDLLERMAKQKRAAIEAATTELHRIEGELNMAQLLMRTFCYGHSAKGMIPGT